MRKTHVGLYRDLVLNAKTFMYPTNVLSTKVVTSHQQVVMASLESHEAPSSIPPEILQYTKKFWAETTAKQKKSLWERFAQFRAARGPIETMDRSAALFICTMEGIKLSTRKTYASNLLGLMDQLAVPFPTLKMARKGMMNMGADSAPEKAAPATISQVNTLIREYMETNPLLSLTFWLMWKTASRFSDVRALTRENFKVVRPQEIIVIFGKTKNNQEQKVKPSSLVQILDRMPMTWQCQLLNSLPPHHNIVPVEYNAFLRHVARLFPILTAHSFKHGARGHLMSEAFAGRLSDIRAIPLLMKHSDPSSNYPEQSIQYGSTQSHIFYARMLGSGRATLVL